MRKLLAIGAAVMLALAISGVAAARGPAGQFAVGSAKTEVDTFVFDEHASFSAHNVPGLPGSCDATGHMVYKNPTLGYDFSADIVQLVVVDSPSVGAAFLVGQVTKVAPGSTPAGPIVWFDAIDGRMPDGQGDQFLFENPNAPFQVCFGPISGHPITSGNIVIKSTGP